MANVSTARKLSILGRIALQHAGQTRTFGALMQAGRVTLSHVGRVLHVLWLEVTGFVFLGIATIVGFAFYHEYSQYAAGKIGPGRAWLAAGVSLMFAWFGLSSFWRARGKGKR
jgi:hypothetical protein